MSKLAIAESGAPGSADFRGHTEHLERLLGSEEVVMAFVAPKLVTALVTTHLPISRVAAAVTPAGVARATYWLTRLLRSIGAPRLRVAIASLNPHAGEGGLLGDEESVSITPGIELARARLAAAGIAADLVGPLGAETAMRRAVAGDFDGVVAMYHDQAMIPTKTLGFGEAVNISLGLPILRTSVDHGTAYDVAWTGQADARGMMAALRLGETLAKSARREARKDGRRA